MKWRSGAGFCAVLAIVGLVNSLLHEGVHWLTGVALGHQIVFGLNIVRATGSISPGDAMLIAAAGPAFTLLLGIVAFVIFRRTGSSIAFSFVLWAAFMRLVAWGISFVSPNDEARVGVALGVGPWVLHALVSAILVGLAISAILRRGSSWTELGLAYLVLSGVTAAIVFGDQAMA